MVTVKYIAAVLSKNIEKWFYQHQIGTHWLPHEPTLHPYLIRIRSSESNSSDFRLIVPSYHIDYSPTDNGQDLKL